MDILKAAKTTPARFALLFAAFSALVMATLLALIYWWISSLLERHLRERVEQQLSVLRDDFTQDGRDSMLGFVRQHEENYGKSPTHFLVIDGAGEVLVGDLPGVLAEEGWQEISLPPRIGKSNNIPRNLRGFGTQLDEDTFVLVAQDTADLRQTRVLLVRSFGIALSLTVLLSLAGGVVIGTTLLRRVEDVNRTARAIMNGDLSQRIPVHEWADELGGLAESLNSMLARIEELMENLRHVTSDIAHDLRSPLSRLRHRLEACRTKSRSRLEYEVAMDAAIEDTNTILKTFEAMLRIAQVEAGTRRARFSSVNLSEVAENVTSAFAAVAEDEDQRFDGHIKAGITIDGDRELLTQLLANVVENALRHTPAGTIIGVELERVNGSVRLTVSDTGPGIPATERERVLRRFHRLDASRSTPGSGLGLSLVAAVAKLHDATISLEDNQPGLRVVMEFA